MKSFFSVNFILTECPSPYEFVNTQCILVVEDRKNWYDALHYCADKSGGQLAEVSDLAVITNYLNVAFASL